MFTNPNTDSREEMKKRYLRRLTLPTTSLGKRQAQKSFKFLEVTLDCRLKLQKHAKKVTAKVKKVMLIIGKFSSVYNGISLAKL